MHKQYILALHHIFKLRSQCQFWFVSIPYQLTCLIMSYVIKLIWVLNRLCVLIFWSIESLRISSNGLMTMLAILVCLQTRLGYQLSFIFSPYTHGLTSTFIKIRGRLNRIAVVIVIWITFFVQKQANLWRLGTSTSAFLCLIFSPRPSILSFTRIVYVTNILQLDWIPWFSLSLVLRR